MKNHAQRIGRAPKWPMSAYSASAPVSTRNTEPSTMNACSAWSCRNEIAYIGLTAPRICGAFTRFIMPSAASAANHSSITGPNSLPTTDVPLRWMRNSTARITSVIGNTNGDKAGAAISSPSMAERTEMAGVITASP